MPTFSPDKLRALASREVSHALSWLVGSHAPCRAWPTGKPDTTYLARVRCSLLLGYCAATRLISASRMSADKLGPLTQAAIEAGRLPAELSAETYSRIADALVLSRIGQHVKRRQGETCLRRNYP